LVSIVCYQRRTREPPAKPLSQHPREMVSAQDRGYDRVIDPDAAQYDLIPKRMASNEGEYVGPPMTNYSQVPMERISTMADYQQPPMERASTSTSAAFSEYGAPPTRLVIREAQSLSFTRAVRLSACAWLTSAGRLRSVCAVDAAAAATTARGLDAGDVHAAARASRTGACAALAVAAVCHA
jgi:hypothetical protein